MEIKKVKKKMEDTVAEKDELFLSQENHFGIWMEFPSLLSIGDVIIDNKNIAGVTVPVFRDIIFNIRDYSLLSNRAWIPGAIEKLKKLVELSIRIRLSSKQMEILHLARKKTTQKVNLYEKVQIPLFKESIGKIKRFLEDEENLSRSGQKVIKARKERERI